jgi:hypothetical protein
MRQSPREAVLGRATGLAKNGHHGVLGQGPFSESDVGLRGKPSLRKLASILK